MSTTALIIICIIVVLLIFSFLRKKTDKSLPWQYKKAETAPPKESMGVDTAAHDNSPKKVSYIHLSILDNYLKKYNLDNSEGSFFQLTNLIIKDGKQYALGRLKTELQAIVYGKDIKNKAEVVVAIFKKIEQEKISLSLGLAPEDRTSPKIYKSAVEKYLNDFDLTVLANNDLQKAMIALLNSLYDLGKMQALRKFEINLKWLGQYLQEGNNKKIEDILRNMMIEIDDFMGELV